jgi:hypothetical protein
MEEGPEKSKELSQSAQANGINKGKGHPITGHQEPRGGVEV